MARPPKLREAFAPSRLRTGAGAVAAVRYARDRALVRLQAGSFGAWGDRSFASQPFWPEVPANVHIGSGVTIGPATRIGAYRAPIVIGDGTEIVGGAHLFAQDAGITIGRDVLMAWNVQIYDADHAFDDSTRPIREQGFVRSASVLIGDGAWLGANVVVTAGVTIGRNAVVGSNAVVLKDVPEYGVVAGVPARPIGVS